jgi:hypothetical protein
VQLLVSQLAEKDAAVLKAGIELNKATEKLAELSAIMEPLAAVAAAAANNMSVAMNGPGNLCDGMTPTQVLAEHARMVPLFKSKFPVGGVAAVAGGASNDQALHDPRRIARVNAARFVK